MSIIDKATKKLKYYSRLKTLWIVLIILSFISFVIFLPITFFNTNYLYGSIFSIFIMFFILKLYSKALKNYIIYQDIINDENNTEFYSNWQKRYQQQESDYRKEREAQERERQKRYRQYQEQQYAEWDNNKWYDNYHQEYNQRSKQQSNQQSKQNKINIQQAFELFKLDINSSDDVIKKKFRELARIWHPDKFVNDSIENQKISERNFKKLNNAYTTIKEYKKIK